MVNKLHIPKNIEELTEIYYGPNGNKRNKYENWAKTKIISPQYEKEVIAIFGSIGDVVKISRSRGKTFDFKIDEEKILIEVTSLDSETDQNSVMTEDKIVSKVNEKISHILEKDKSSFQDYYTGGVIFYTTILNFRSELGVLIQDSDFIKKCEITESDVDFLVFLPESASINNQDSRKMCPPVFYVKNKSLLRLFSEKFSDKEYLIKYLS